VDQMKKKIVAFAVPYMEGHHDAGHYYRVESFGRQLWQREGGDWIVIFTALRLHDIGRKINVRKHPKIGADIARGFLPQIGFPADKLEAVVRSILLHDKHGGQRTIEEKIVYDADRLDCFTYSGLIRCFLEARGKRGVEVTLPERVQCAEKYLKLAYKSFNTKTAQEIASEYKREFMFGFLSRIKGEQRFPV